MKKYLLISLAAIAIGLSVSTVKASPMGLPLEIGTWSVSDDSTATGGPWSPQSVSLSMTNEGPDHTIVVQTIGANGAVAGTYSFAFPPGGGDGVLSATIPAGGTVRVIDLSDNDDDGATGRYVIG